ncbi:MAG: type II toxin-antitoxin system VapC family toxin [Burkholderiales bacterium]|nr:type II toxin-antitoxin system VapC family toxin [Burkholderiales bacterium]
MAFVLDSSVALTWLLQDESNAAADALADRLEQENAHVPPIWHLEVGNALITAMRRKRITDADFDRSILALSALPIEIDATASLADVLAIARRFGLTSYDAAYLELAQRRGFPLATLDGKLRQACKALKVSVLP